VVELIQAHSTASAVYDFTTRTEHRTSA